MLLFISQTDELDLTRFRLGRALAWVLPVPAVFDE